MKSTPVGQRFIISSLPRCGSTTLTRLLNEHPNIRCLIEPFHPARYGARPNRLAQLYSMQSALDAIWTRWNGIKHVWEPNGWPFVANPTLNDDMFRQDVRVLMLIRRNLLRRYISNHICRASQYWIGTRREFHSRCKNLQLKPLSCEVVSSHLRRDADEVARRRRMLSSIGAQHCVLAYEDLFGTELNERQQLSIINSLLEFLGFVRLGAQDVSHSWREHFDPGINKWSSEVIYRLIPNIDEIEARCGNAETGWLFR